MDQTERAMAADVRVEDYLNDKLQSVADLETLDSLLDNVKSQHELLQKQVRLPTKTPRFCLYRTPTPTLTLARTARRGQSRP